MEATAGPRAVPAGDDLTLAPFPALAELRRQYDLAWREGGELSVIVAGLDGFRMINDRLGPIEADIVLSTFAARLGCYVERVTLLYGDQLLGVLPGLIADDAASLADDLRGQIGKAIVTSLGRLTVSVGIAEYPDSALSAEELVYGAQAAMYWAKAMGGNRTGYWGELLGVSRLERPVTPPPPVAALASALERKTRAGAGQLVRSAWYARKVARELGIAEADRGVIADAALLHDIGKLALSDDLLMRPGSLDEAEKAAVRAHPRIGARIVGRLPQLTGAGPIIASHHEHFDGSGYPQGLMGDQIPLGARILLVSDAFDAMTTYRSYKSVISLQEALEELRRCAGQQFDRRVVDAFTSLVGREGLKALHWSRSRG